MLECLSGGIKTGCLSGRAACWVHALIPSLFEDEIDGQDELRTDSTATNLTGFPFGHAADDALCFFAATAADVTLDLDVGDGAVLLDDELDKDLTGDAAVASEVGVLDILGEVLVELGLTAVELGVDVGDDDYFLFDLFLFFLNDRS